MLSCCLSIYSFPIYWRKVRPFIHTTGYQLFKINAEFWILRNKGFVTKIGSFGRVLLSMWKSCWWVICKYLYKRSSSRMVCPGPGESLESNSSKFFATKETKMFCNNYQRRLVQFVRKRLNKDLTHVSSNFFYQKKKKDFVIIVILLLVDDILPRRCNCYIFLSFYLCRYNGFLVLNFFFNT